MDIIPAVAAIIKTYTKKGPGHGGRSCITANACATANACITANACARRREMPPYNAKPFGKGNLIKLPIPLNPDATPFIPQRFV